MLLDSQTLIWFMQGDSRLGRGATRLLESAPFLHYSALSVMELTMKSLSLGPNGKPKLELPTNFVQMLNAGGFKELTLESSDSTELSKFLALHRHDPIGRMLLAQASKNQMPFLTSDRVLLSLGLDWVVDAQE
jgi:PIN domain nuclease of toxin-antitoxin system